MYIPFRQGVVYAPPNFLQLSGGTVSLQIAVPDLVIAVVADGDSDYLINERLPVANAWAGPFVAGPQSYWLYWDINVVTGQRTFGHTLLEPAEGSTPPASPQNDQHWFDTNVNKMKVWNTAAARWVTKIRVFAAMLAGGSVITSMSVNAPAFQGTQVGSLASIPIQAGPIVFDEFGLAVKRNNGAFFTTEDVVVTGVASGAQVKLASAVVEAVAESNIPAYSVVRFSGFNRILQATNFHMNSNNVFGMIEKNAATGEVVNVVTSGVVTNPAWDWTAAGINAPIYIDNVGQLTTTPPAIPQVIGIVVDIRSILIRPSVLSTTAPSSLALDDLTDVDVAAVNDGDVLTFNSVDGEWIPSAPGGGGTSLMPQVLFLSLTGTFDGTPNYAWTTVAEPSGAAGFGSYVSYDTYTQLFTLTADYTYEVEVKAQSSGSWPIIDSTTYGTDFNPVTVSLVGGVTYNKSRYHRRTEPGDAFIVDTDVVTWLDRYIFSGTTGDTFGLGVLLSSYNNPSTTSSIDFFVTIRPIGPPPEPA